MAGVNGLAGHELIHRREPYNKAIGMFTFSKVLYSHFLLEHNSGHHRNVATPEDSATARVGEDFYSFTIRSAVGGHMNTWHREINRIQTKYNDDATKLQLLLQNRITWFTCLHLGLMVTIYSIFGTKAVMFQLGYAGVGIFFIELINYTEHYGLVRKKDKRGIYEPIGESHSWNAASSHLLFRI